MARSTTPAACPCSPEQTYANCCGPYHAGEPAPTPATLMRSRYSAYVLGLSDYLLSTWHTSTRPTALNLRDEPARKWLGLTIIQQSLQADDAGVVEFLARYKIGGRAYRLHETSRFVREHGRWFYRDGDIHE